MVDEPHRHWSDWNRSDWNAALLSHFFDSREKETRPVVRLSVTPDELCDVVGETDADASRVRDAFLKAVRCSVDRFRHFLSARVLHEWDAEDPPPFFVFLIFTCFVASGFDEDVVDEGNFRKRIRTLLGFSERSSLQLRDLADLWRRFQNWLDGRIAKGRPYRPLVLPDPGHMVRIGHSVRLAFPRRKDLVRLADELDQYDSPEELPVHEVLRSISKERDRFSKVLRDELDDFRSKVRKGHLNSRLYDHPFWVALRAATTLPSSEENDEENSPTYQLMLDVNRHPRRLVLLSSSFSEEQRGGFAGELVEADAPGYAYVVAGSEDASVEPAASLLRGTLPKGMPGLAQSLLPALVREGVLLFVPNEAGYWELSSTLPEPEEEVRAFVREDLATNFRRQYGTIDRSSMHDSQYSGWQEVDRFRGKQLRGTSPDGDLEDVRCLRRTLLPPRIRLTGSVALGDGYLGIPPLLPTVEIPEADEVKMHRLGGAAEETVELVRREEAFEIPCDDDTRIEGDYNVVARSNGNVVAQRHLTFIRWNLLRDYKRPTRPETWIAEGSRLDCRRLSGDPLSASPAGRDESRGAHVSFPATKPSSTRDDEAGARYEISPEEERRVSRFVECCSALAANRKGIPTPEFVRLIKEVLGVREHRLMWDVARSWVESGCFDRAARTRWRGASYFAISPHLVVHERSGECRAVLVGLAPTSVRRRLKRSAREHGAREEERRAFSPWFPPMLSWTAPDARAFEAICEKCELPPPEDLPSFEDVLAPVEEVISGTRRKATHYEFHKSWDWEDQSFSDFDPAPDLGVQIERLWRHDRPDMYRMYVNGEEVGCTPARNWSLLFAYSLRGQLPYAEHGRRTLVRGVRGQVYLPLPVARHLAVVGGTAPGPRRAGDAWTYGYDCPNGRLRERLVSGLWKTFDRSFVAGRLRWIAALARRFRGTRSVPYRPSESLTAHIDDPYLQGVLRELGAAPIPSRVLPYLRDIERDVGSQNALEK